MENSVPWATPASSPTKRTFGRSAPQLLASLAHPLQIIPLVGNVTLPEIIGDEYLKGITKEVGD